MLHCRCADIPYIHRNKSKFAHILAIIPGPSEPKNIMPYIKRTVAAFARLGPSGNGMKVTEHILRNNTGEVAQGRTFTHKVLLTGIYADTPANRKLSLAMGHAATLGCLHCSLRGTHSNGMRFLGYSERTDAGTHACINSTVGLMLSS